MDCHFLLQGIFPTQGSNPGLPHCRHRLYRLSHQRSRYTLVVLCKAKVLVAQSCPTVYDPMDCSPPGSSVHEVLQARTLEWVAISSSRTERWVAHKICQGQLSVHLPIPHEEPCPSQWQCPCPQRPAARTPSHQRHQQRAPPCTHVCSWHTHVAALLHPRWDLSMQTACGEDVLKLRFEDHFHNFWENWQVGNESRV